MNPPSTLSRRCLLFSAAVTLSLIGACSDRDPTGPPPDSEPPSLTVYPNGGAVPEVIITYPDSITEALLFTFTPGGPLVGQIDGSSYGVDFGHWDGTEYPRGNAYWSYHSEPSYNVENLPSPGYAASAMYAPHQAFIEFDPPVRSVEFYYAAMDGSSHPDFGNSIPITAYTSNFWPVDQITAPTNGSSWPLQVWDLVQLSSPTDQISWLWIDGSLYIDDLKITRAPACGTSLAMSASTAQVESLPYCPAPEIECDPVIRGEETTCRIVDPTTVQSVLGWQWEGDVFGSPGHVIPGILTATSWSGIAVESGTVTATITVSGAQDTLEGWLEVSDRTGPAWAWNESKWHFADSTTNVLCLQDYARYEMAIDSLRVRLATNRRKDACDSDSFEPSLRDDPRGGYQIKEVLDNGPNAGLWFVDSVSYYIDHVAERNPYLEPDSDSTRVLTDRTDRRICQNALGLGKHDAVVVNFYTYNEMCQGFDLAPMYTAIWKHEGKGTMGPGPNANGHEGRRQYKTSQPEGNPYLAAEPKVSADSTGLHSNVQFTVWDVQTAVNEYAGNHEFVKDNYVVQRGNKTSCGRAWVYDSLLNLKYYEVEVKQKDEETGREECL